MKVLTSLSVLPGAIGAAVLILACFGIEGATGQTTAPAKTSWPPDKTNYTRPISRSDAQPLGRSAKGPHTQSADPKNAAPPTIFMADVVVSNTDPNLTFTDRENDGETSISVNPNNPLEIVSSAFSGEWVA